MLEIPPRPGANPNVCPSCERLLEDESPILLAEIGSIEPEQNPDHLIDRPQKLPEVTPAPLEEKPTKSGPR